VDEYDCWHSVATTFGSTFTTDWRLGSCLAALGFRWGVSFHPPTLLTIASAKGVIGCADGTENAACHMQSIAACLRSLVCWKPWWTLTFVVPGV